MKNLTTKSMFFKMTALAVTALAFSILLAGSVHKSNENVPLSSSITIDTELKEHDLLCTYLTEDKFSKD